MNSKLTPELKERLVQILVDDGCQCDEEHDDASEERINSLNCLASAALYDLERAQDKAKRCDTALNSSQMKYAGARARIEKLEALLGDLGEGLTPDDVLAVLKQRNEAHERLHLAAHQISGLSYKIKCYEHWLTMLAATQHESNIDPATAVKKLRSAALTSFMVLKDPSALDPEKMAERAQQARDALNGSADGNAL